MNQTDFLVAGAGPSGLTFAAAAGGTASVAVLEKSSSAGGISQSIEQDGGVFDIGGHSFHTPHREVMDFLVNEVTVPLEGQKREARVWFNGRLLNYPFQQSFNECGSEEIIRQCEEGMRARPETPSRKNYESWLTEKFGEGICRHFMFPYNRKLWGSDLTSMDATWVDQRVASTQQGKFESSTMERKPLEADTKVYYPEKGGFGTIFQRMARMVKNLQLNSELKRINTSQRLVTLADGREWKYGDLVFTGSITQLPAIIQNFPGELAEQIRQLRVVPLKVVLLLANRQLRGDVQRIYSADPAWPWHKLALNHNSSTHLRRRPVHAIMAEVSAPAQTANDPQQLSAEVTSNLLEMDVIQSESEIQWANVLNVPWGYPVPQPQTRETVEAVSEWCAEAGIHLLGRFGRWSYINSDACIKQSLDLKRMLCG